MNIFKNILTLLLLLLMNTVSAQQEALYSQYMFNQFTINPAYAGTRNALSSVLLYRSQWAGLDGAPNTMNFSIHSPFSGRNMALGLNFIFDEIGPTETSKILGTYAYHLKTSKGKISFGLRGGLISRALRNDMLNFFDNNDVHNTGGVFQVNAPIFDFGLYYYTSSVYAGLSVNNMLTQKYVNSGQSKFNYDTHIMFATGGVVVLSENLVLKPSLMLRHVAHMPLSYELTSSVLLNKTLWLGASYRSSKNIVFITEYNISDFLRIGYSFDLDLSILRRYNTGSHEVFIGCDLNLQKDKSISPRYL